jgi:hypothetical protein
MNGTGAILLAVLALAAVAGAEAVHDTLPAWQRVASADWLPERWTNPPICSNVELTVGCVAISDVPSN